MSEPSSPIASLRVWDHVRALLVGVHLVLITVMALPNPSRVSEKDLKDPALQEVFADWRGVLDGVGVQLSVDETNDLAIRFANQYMDARAVVLKPFRPYFRYTGASQSWQMFGYLNRSPARLSIEVFTPGESWTTLYLARDPTYDWRRTLFDSERMRGMMSRYSWKEKKRSYTTFVNWLACAVAREHPDATSIRVSMKQVQIPRPDVFRQTGTMPTKQTYWLERRLLKPCREEAEAVP